MMRLRASAAALGFPVVDGAIAYRTTAEIGIDIPEDLIQHFLLAEVSKTRIFWCGLSDSGVDGRKFGWQLTQHYR